MNMEQGPTYHPTEDLLMDAAAGVLCSVTHLVVLTHCSLCPACHGSMSAYEMIRGALEDENMGGAKDIDPEVLKQASEQAPNGPLGIDPALAHMPAPLFTMALEALEDRDWHELMPGIASLDLDGQMRGDQTEVSLLRFQPGAVGPWHTHDGVEAIVVLAGSLSDHRGTFTRGDIIASGPEITHAPIAGPDEVCYCLSISDTPAMLVAAPDVTEPTLEVTEIT